jgi:hypothetical protein
MTSLHNELDAFVLRISEQVAGMGDDMTPIQLRRQVHEAKKTFVTGVDDICVRIISAIHSVPASPRHSIDLMDEVLSLHTWYRLHRGLMWQKIEGAARYAPVAAQFQRLETTIRRCSQKGQVSPGVSNHLLGMLRAAFEDYEAAAGLFRQAPFNPATFMSGFYNGSSTFKPPSAAWLGIRETAPHLDTFLKVRYTYSARRSCGTGPLFVFSADANYFNGLAEGMLDSLLASGADIDVEIVVIADRELIDEVATRLIAALDRTGASGRIVVVETEFNIRTLSAVARYLWAGEQLTTRGRSCAIFDLDVLFTRGTVEEIMLIADRCDLGLSYGVYGRAVAPWSTYLAGATFVRAGNLGEFFLDRFRWFVGEGLVPGHGQWFIDQNAIFAAEYLTTRLFPAGVRTNLGGLLNRILENLEVEKVTKVKRNAVA